MNINTVYWIMFGIVVLGPPILIMWKFELWRVWTNDPLGERKKERDRLKKLSNPPEHP